MNKDIAKKMEYQLRLLGWIVNAGLGEWKGFDVDKSALTIKQLDINTTRFFVPGKEDRAYVDVTNIAPVKISDTTFHEPLTLNKQVSDAYSSVANNKSDSVEMTRTYQIAESSETTNSTDVGVSVALGITQTIGYGGEIYGVSGETEISTSIETSFNKGWSFTSTTERSVETQITIPPKTRTTLTATKSISTLKQDVDYTADLEFSLTIMNYNNLLVQIDSQADLRKALDGNGYPGMFKQGAGFDSQDRLTEVMHGLGAINDTWKGILATPVNAMYTDTIEFKNAVTGDVVLTSLEL